MIEKIIYDYLENKIDVPVYLSIPSDPADEFVTIEKTAGNEENHIESAVFAVQSYSSKSLLRACKLNEDVKTAMRKITAETSVMHCKLNTNYNFTDTRTKFYRYQSVFDINY
ncbi:MAG: hypothetical protein KBT03_10855 [Bacteroidales bacterium]|nr:hypothetical protein [Candidatus Scybalousia scybalohippi]